MFIDQYYSEPNGHICFTRAQGSDFAKRIADDFNPLHDVDAKRFCIPGDLLFATLLAKYGISQRMGFVFSGMVFEGVELVLPPPTPHLQITDTAGREYLQVERSGDESRDSDLIENLARNYVEFSGHTFPHILQPLLAREQVMINLARPMVIYESMSFELDRLDLTSPMPESDRGDIKIDGKRGVVTLHFNLLEAGEVVGRGMKRILLGGLRAYEPEAVAATIADYNERKRVYFST